MSIALSDQYPDWQRKVKLLTSSVWQDANINEARIDQWLENFTGAFTDVEVERRHAFHLLQQFLFFGKQEVTECLRVLFRDHFVYPIVQELRAEGCLPGDIESELGRRLQANTRFVAVGHPSESGHRFLYDFRTTNDLSIKLFPEVGEVERTICPKVKFRTKRYLRKAVAPVFDWILEMVLKQKNAWESLDADRLVPYGLQHLVFLDDFCATGEQVQDRVGRFVDRVRSSDQSIRISYYLLFATIRGLRSVRASKLFEDVQAAIVLDDDYASFGANSHYYRDGSSQISQEIASRVMHYYGSKIYASAPLGFGDCQLLLGFEHNTPDNTLPVFWAKGESVPWSPIFPRARKY